MRFACLAAATLVCACASSPPTINRAGGGTGREAPVKGGLLAAQLAGSEANANANIAADAAAARRASEASARCQELAQKVLSFEEEALLGLGISDVAAAKVPNRGLYLDAPGGPQTERTELTRYLALLGGGLAAYSSRPAIPWTFLVLDADEVTSFSAPGGYVWVTTGLLRAVDDEAQLAGVLAHEISHVALGHGLEAWRKAKVATCQAAAVTSALRGPSGGDSLAGPDEVAQRELAATLAEGTARAVIETGYGPRWELDADASAVGLLLFAGYDVASFTRFLTRLTPATTQSAFPSVASRALHIADTRTKVYAGFDFARLKSPPLPACVTSLRK